MRFFLCLLGLVLVLEGLPYFAFPDGMKRWMLRIQDIPSAHLRILGFLTMCAGLLITYLFR